MKAIHILNAPSSKLEIPETEHERRAAGNKMLIQKVLYIYTGIRM